MNRFLLSFCDWNEMKKRTNRTNCAAYLCDRLFGIFFSLYLFLSFFFLWFECNGNFFSTDSTENCFNFIKRWMHLSHHLLSQMRKMRFQPNNENRTWIAVTLSYNQKILPRINFIHSSIERTMHSTKLRSQCISHRFVWNRKHFLLHIKCEQQTNQCLSGDAQSHSILYASCSSSQILLHTQRNCVSFSMRKILQRNRKRTNSN